MGSSTPSTTAGFGIPGPRSASTFGTEAGAECGSAARSDLCGGRPKSKGEGRPYRDHHVSSILSIPFRLLPARKSIDSSIRAPLGLIAIVVPLALRLMSGSAAANGRVRYTGIARWIIAVCASLPLVAAALAATSSREGDARGALILGALAALGICGALAFWRVNHSYNDKGIDYRTPWSPNRIVSWSDIKEIKWRSAMKWLGVVPADRAPRMHFSPLLAGLDGLATHVLRNAPELALRSEPDAFAVLRPMASGHARVLLNDARKPSVIAAQLLDPAT